MKNKKACDHCIFDRIRCNGIILSIVSNYFFVYPIYYNFMSKDLILQASQGNLSGCKEYFTGIIGCVSNVPFTLLKGLICVVLAWGSCMCLVLRFFEPAKSQGRFEPAKSRRLTKRKAGALELHHIKSANTEAQTFLFAL